MNSSSNSNLKELCRACLRTLKKDRHLNDDSVAINELPNLCELFVFLTTNDVNKEYDGFPKRLCKSCYDRLLNYDEFRKLVARSTEVLHEQWNSCKNRVNNVKENSLPVQLLQNVKLEKSVEECNDDKLLLPVLENMPLEVKLEAMDAKFILPSYGEGEAEKKTDEEELRLANADDSNSSLTISSSDGNVVLSKGDLGKKSDGKVVLSKGDRESLHCPDCNKKFYKQVCLDGHIQKTHLGQIKPFQCKNCTKAFSKNKALFVHMKRTHLEMLFRCDYENCDAAFLEATKLEMHREIEHHALKELAAQYKELEAESIAFQMEHICHLCRRKYRSKGALKNHIKRHKNIKEHVCPECGVAKVTSSELKSHRRIHMRNSEKFSCPKCPQVFNKKYLVAKHVKSIHEGNKRYTCEYCPKRFVTRKSQANHERLLHADERPYANESHKKSFAQIEKRRSHMRNQRKLRKRVCK